MNKPAAKVLRALGRQISVVKLSAITPGLSPTRYGGVPEDEILKTAREMGLNVFTRSGERWIELRMARTTRLVDRLQ
jgi:hypothetical protein